jgi:hypothetical protein
MVPGAFLYYAPRKKLDDVTRSFVAERPESVPFFDLVCSPRLFSLHIDDRLRRKDRPGATVGTSIRDF